MTAVVNIIKAHIPELVALNLSNNRLNTLVYLQPLVSATPNMVGLDLSDNAEVLYHRPSYSPYISACSSSYRKNSIKFMLLILLL